MNGVSFLSVSKKNEGRDCLRKQKRKSDDSERKDLPLHVQIAVLTESGYRCAVPTCRGILAIDLHHIVAVSAGGPDVPENLLALCPTCHGLYHRGTIHSDSIYVWKSVLISLSRAFDVATLDYLLLLGAPESNSLLVSGDGVLIFSRMIGGGLAAYRLELQNGPMVLYSLRLTNRGESILAAWKGGNLDALAKALNQSVA